MYAAQTSFQPAVYDDEMGFPSMSQMYLGNSKTMTARASVIALSALFCVALLCCLPEPVSLTAKASEKSGKGAGTELFHTKGCEHCHGVNGQDGDRGPDLRSVGRRLSKQQIEHQIRNGGSQMPAFGEALSAAEIHDLVEMLHDKRAK